MIPFARALTMASGLLTTLALLAGLGVVSTAEAAPAEKRAITACFHKRTGDLRIVLDGTREDCGPRERFLRWQRRGVAGPAGPAGPASVAPMFSASLSETVLGGSEPVRYWDVSAPGFGTPSFDTLQGRFTVPSTGIYHLTASCNVALEGEQTASLASQTQPALTLRRIAPTTTALATAQLPVLDVDIIFLLTLRALVEGPVALDTTVALDAGDVVRLDYDADGLSRAVRLNECRFAATQVG